MSNKALPPSVASFLTAHGAESLAEDGLSDLASLVRAFRDSAPAEDSDPFSQTNLTWLTALLDCIGVMDECLYEHYRAMIDLFRAGVFRAPREKLLAYPSWNGLREKAVHLGVLPADLYGRELPRPHLNIPDAYVRTREGVRK